MKLTASNSAGSDDEIKTGYVTVGAPLTFITFTPGADAFVSSSSPTKNYGSDVQLRVRASSTNYRSYLKFTATGLDGPVKSARLRLFVSDASPDGGSIYAVANGWTETAINWNNAPVLPGSAIRSIGATPPVGSWVDVDLGTAITGNGTYSFGIASNSTNSAYYSSRQGTNPPQLIVGYEAGGTPEITPVAAFSATPTSGPAPLSVTFSDASTNQPTSWAWDFQNDGSVDSTAQNPVFTYNTAGTYSVKLTAVERGRQRRRDQGQLRDRGDDADRAGCCLLGDADVRPGAAFGDVQRRLDEPTDELGVGLPERRLGRLDRPEPGLHVQHGRHVLGEADRRKRGRQR